MSKHIIIVGGGISGLATLHYLRQKYQGQSDITIKLLERESETGGKIRTLRCDGIQFENGPNGFLDSNPSTFQLATEIGLKDELIAADPSAKIRYICVDDQLYALPMSPPAFFGFKPMSFLDKLRVFQEPFIARGQDPDETVHEFATRRMGPGIAKYFFGPLVSGVLGGDSRELNLKYSFPKIFELEQTHGSVIKGLFASAKGKKTKTQLWSFKMGMGCLTEKLTDLYTDSIETGVAISSIFREEEGYTLEAEGKKYFANEVILSVPAYAAAELIMDMDDSLGQWLSEINYASIAVVGLSFLKDQFTQLPKGFGYLHINENQSEVLGTVFSSNIFRPRCSADKVFMQVMLGGARNPDTIRKSDEEIFDLAKTEVEKLLGARGEPKTQFIARWGKAIPQYDRAYPQARIAIESLLNRYPGLHLQANYWDGVSVNDCVANAKTLSEKVLLDSSVAEPRLDKIFQ